MTLRRFKSIVGTLVLLAGAAACAHRQEGKRSLSPVEQARWTADSTVYVQDLNRWLRDSTIIDSIARTIDVDSLRALFRAVWTLPHPGPAFQELLCEQSRINWKHGLLAGTRAAQKVQGEEWGADEREANRRIGEKMPGAGVLKLSNELCHITGPRAPETLDGTPLFYAYPRPRPPQRPGSSR